jgi:hypothetical protein
MTSNLFVRIFPLPENHFCVDARKANDLRDLILNPSGGCFS